jgi:broad specificity phosphatase PhoE
MEATELHKRGMISDRAAKRRGADVGRGVEIYIVRHGATKMNNQTDMSEDRIRGWANVPLSDEGREEARKAAKKLERIGIEVIFTSDLVRAEETARIIGQATGLKPIVTKKLRPWDLGELTGAATKRALPIVAKYACDTPDKPVPKGESFNSFCARGFEGLADCLRSANGKKLLIVTHHRLERLLEAWDVAGQPSDHRIDIKTFLDKGDPPGHVEKLTIDAASMHSGGKKSHADVHYRLAKGEDKCANCKAYVGPNECRKVVAPISPRFWCVLGHSRKDGHAFSQKSS